MRRLVRRYATLSAASLQLAIVCALAMPPTIALARSRLFAPDLMSHYVSTSVRWIIVWCALVGGGLYVLANAKSKPIDALGWELIDSFDEIKKDDPTFSEQAFRERVEAMFLSTLQAWQKRDMSPVRHLLGRQQCLELTRGAAKYARRGVLHRLANLKVDGITPVAVAHTDNSCLLKIEIRATAIDCTIDERTGQPVSPEILGDGHSPRAFAEFWILERQTGARPAVFERLHTCPTCGAPATDGSLVTCSYCGTVMNDPALSWIAVRIQPPRDRLTEGAGAHPAAGSEPLTSTTRSV